MAKTVFTERYNGRRNRLINTSILTSGIEHRIAITQWDTGATGTCISKSIAAQLKLQPIGMLRIRTPSGTTMVNRYIVDIILNQEIRIKNLEVLETEIGSQGIDVLIGMDIISCGDFAVSNFNGNTQFTFRIPSKEDISFVEEDSSS